MWKQWDSVPHKMCLCKRRMTGMIALCVRNHHWFFLSEWPWIFSLRESWILNQCLPPWVIEVNHYFLYVAEHFSQLRPDRALCVRACVCVLRALSGGWLNSLNIITLLPSVGSYILRSERVEEESGALWEPTRQPLYNTFTWWVCEQTTDFCSKEVGETINGSAT